MGVDVAMRGLFRSDRAGAGLVHVDPARKLPDPRRRHGGPAAACARRNIMRPGHVHVRIEAPGFRRLTTMLFLEGDPYLDADPVFGVKQSLVMPFVQKRPGSARPDGKAVPSPAWCVDYDFVLARAA
jgi:hydroxyquinol 1,2-dioxygenase